MRSSIPNIAIDANDVLPPVEIDGFEAMLAATEVDEVRERDVVEGERHRGGMLCARDLLVDRYFARLLNANNVM